MRSFRSRGRRLGRRWRIAIAVLLGLGSAAGQPEMANLGSVRRAHLAYWRELGASEVGGLERFALTVQRVVDTRALQTGTSAETARRLILDDLVDLFVSVEFGAEKALVMSTPPLLGDDSVDEEEDDLIGFAPLFREGEGRFRHFALNAAASRSAPDALVEFAARVRGRDLTGSSPDSTADLATNRIGREFSRLLFERPLEELADGSLVHDWIVRRFGPR
jgi:hypothetical protein